MQTQIKQVTQETIAQSRALRRKASARYAQERSDAASLRASMARQQGDGLGHDCHLNDAIAWHKLAASYGVNV